MTTYLNTLQTLSAAFILGIAFHYSLTSKLSYASGFGKTIIQYRRRFVLVLFLLFASLWTKLTFLDFAMPSPRSCQAIIALSTLADQAARTTGAMFMLGLTGNKVKSRGDRYILMAALAARSLLGVLFVGFSRPQFAPICVATSSIIGIPAFIIAVDAAIIAVSIFKVTRQEAWKGAWTYPSTTEKEQIKASMLFIAGYATWFVTSTPMLIGTKNTPLFVRTAVPCIGLYVLIALIERYQGALFYLAETHNDKSYAQNVSPPKGDTYSSNLSGPQAGPTTAFIPPTVPRIPSIITTPPSLSSARPVAASAPASRSLPVVLENGPGYETQLPSHPPIPPLSQISRERRQSTTRAVSAWSASTQDTSTRSMSQSTIGLPSNPRSSTKPALSVHTRNLSDSNIIVPSVIPMARSRGLPTSTVVRPPINLNPLRMNKPPFSANSGVPSLASRRSKSVDIPSPLRIATRGTTTETSQQWPGPRHVPIPSHIGPKSYETDLGFQYGASQAVLPGQRSQRYAADARPGSTLTSKVYAPMPRPSIPRKHASSKSVPSGSWLDESRSNSAGSIEPLAPPQPAKKAKADLRKSVVPNMAPLPVSDSAEKDIQVRFFRDIVYDDPKGVQALISDPSPYTLTEKSLPPVPLQPRKSSVPPLLTEKPILLEKEDVKAPALPVARKESIETGSILDRPRFIPRTESRSIFGARPESPVKIPKPQTFKEMIGLGVNMDGTPKADEGFQSGTKIVGVSGAELAASSAQKQQPPNAGPPRKSSSVCIQFTPSAIYSMPPTPPGQRSFDNDAMPGDGPGERNSAIILPATPDSTDSSSRSRESSVDSSPENGQSRANCDSKQEPVSKAFALHGRHRFGDPLESTLSQRRMTKSTRIPPPLALQALKAHSDVLVESPEDSGLVRSLINQIDDQMQKNDQAFTARSQAGSRSSRRRSSAVMNSALVASFATEEVAQATEVQIIKEQPARTSIVKRSSQAPSRKSTVAVSKLWSKTVPRKSVAFAALWQPRKAAMVPHTSEPFRPMRAQARPRQSAAEPAPIKSKQLWKRPSPSVSRPMLLWGVVAPLLFRGPVVSTIRAPRRKSRRMTQTSLPEIIESPTMIPGRKDSLGVFRLPSGPSDSVTMKTMPPLPKLLLSPGQLRAVASIERGGSSPDIGNSLTPADDEFDESTLWEIASILHGQSFSSS